MIRISKTKMMFHYIEVSSESEEPKSIDIMETTLGMVSYLQFHVELDEDVTVEDIMRMLARNPETTDYVFDSALGGHSFKEFAKEMDEDVPNSTNIEYMEISHQVDPIGEEMNLFEAARLRGIGRNGKLFSVEFSPVSSYMRFPLRVNEQFALRFDNDKTLELNKSFTLYEFISAILYEMSYYGGPEMRKAALEEILSQNTEEPAEETEDEFEVIDASVTHDEVSDMQKQLENLIDLEDYEAAARLRDRIRQAKDSGTNGGGFDIKK